MIVRLWTLDAECGRCRKRPLLRLSEEGRRAWAALPPRTIVAQATCGTAGCEDEKRQRSTYEITARAVREGQEVRRLTLVGETVVDGPEAPDPLASLSPRQQQVYAGVVGGKTDARIARDLELSPWTVRMHMEDAAERLRSGMPSLPLASPRRTMLAHFAAGMHAAA